MAAWDQSASVLCAILHTDLVTMPWALGFRNLQIPGPVMPIAGMPFDHARNVACMRALEMGADFLFFLDSDVVPPHDAVHRLIARSEELRKKHGQYQIVSGMYCRRSPPEAVPVMIRGGQWVTKFKAGSVIEVDVCGAGCLLIHRSTLEKCPPQNPQVGHHWFDWRVDMANLVKPGYALSEDFTFNVHARETMGVKTFVDTSICCRHVGLAEAQFGTFRPANADPNT